MYALRGLCDFGISSVKGFTDPRYVDGASLCANVTTGRRMVAARRIKKRLKELEHKDTMR